MAQSYSLLKRVLIGRPLASDADQHTRLPKLLALPVFAADVAARHPGSHITVARQGMVIDLA